MWTSVHERDWRLLRIDFQSTPEKYFMPANGSQEKPDLPHLVTISEQGDEGNKRRVTLIEGAVVTHLSLDTQEAFSTLTLVSGLQIALVERDMIAVERIHRYNTRQDL
jgi:hypothetical protein